MLCRLFNPICLLTYPELTTTIDSWSIIIYFNSYYYILLHTYKAIKIYSNTSKYFELDIQRNRLSTYSVPDTVLNISHFNLGKIIMVL